MTKKLEYEETTNCGECGSNSLETDRARGEMVCADCGLVVEQGTIDQGAEWRAFDRDQDNSRSRTGRPLTPLLHDYGLATEISWRDVDHSGAPLSSRTKKDAYRWRKWQRRSRAQGARSRNLVLALTEIERMAGMLHLPKDTRETSAIIYRKALNANLIRGRSIEGVAAASVYAACREHGIPRTLDEISKVARTGRKEIGRVYRFMRRTLSLETPIPKPEDYVYRFCSQLGLKSDVQQAAISIIEQAREAEIVSGRGPTGVCASAIYIASIMHGNRRTQSEIAEVANVTEVTIRNRYKEILERLGMDLMLE